MTCVEVGAIPPNAEAMSSAVIPQFPTTQRIEHVAVVVPAHNEQERIGRCLKAIARAARRLAPAVSVDLVVVADDCVDATATLARAAGAAVKEVRLRNVGAARDAGVRFALERPHGVDERAIWLAHTDADTIVPRHWIAAQLSWHRRGADAVAGTVRVADWSEHPPVVRARFLDHQRRIGLGRGHGHVHGANLGLTAALYREVGGFPPLSCAEDEALWHAIRLRGCHPIQADDLEVTTSARRSARAPGGFSQLLVSLGEDASSDDDVPVAAHRQAT